jgi:hypothetical protein
MRFWRVARTLGALSRHTVLRPNARRRLCMAHGVTPQHAVPRKAPRRVVVLGRAVMRIALIFAVGLALADCNNQISPEAKANMA